MSKPYYSLSHLKKKRRMDKMPSTNYSGYGQMILRKISGTSLFVPPVPQSSSPDQAKHTLRGRNHGCPKNCPHTSPRSSNDIWCMFACKYINGLVK